MMDSELRRKFGARSELVMNYFKDLPAPGKRFEVEKRGDWEIWGWRAGSKEKGTRIAITWQDRVQLSVMLETHPVGEHRSLVVTYCNDHSVIPGWAWLALTTAMRDEPDAPDQGTG
jgi:hypothetical protein